LPSGNNPAESAQFIFIQFLKYFMEILLPNLVK